jgi:hypothetical protein
MNSNLFIYLFNIEYTNIANVANVANVANIDDRMYPFTQIFFQIQLLTTVCTDN